MRKLAFAALIAGAALALAGCGGPKVEGVPGTVAKVNGNEISNKEYFAELNAKAGREVLSNMIEREVIISWAEDEKVPVTDEQIKKQIENLKRDDVYQDQVKIMGEEGLRNEIEAAQARINVAKKFIKIPDQEVSQIYNMRKQEFNHGPRKRVALLINPDKAKVEAAAKELKAGADFDKVAAKYSPSPMPMQSAPKIWLTDDQPGAPKEVLTAVKATKMGEVSDVITFSAPNGPKQYLILKVIKTQGKASKSLKQASGEIEDMLALQRASFDPKFNKELTKRKKDAKIDIEIKGFDDVKDRFENPQPQQMPMMGGPGGMGAPAPGR